MLGVVLFETARERFRAVVDAAVPLVFAVTELVAGIVRVLDVGSGRDDAVRRVVSIQYELSVREYQCVLAESGSPFPVLIIDATLVTLTSPVRLSSVTESCGSITS